MIIMPELTILLLNGLVLAIAYFIVFPILAGNDLNKVLMNDLMASLVSLSVAGFLFWGTRTEFNLVIAQVNWFWFTISTYALFETPLMVWYLKKNNLWSRAS